MRALIGYTVIALTLLSLWWTTVKARRLLSRSLGRKIRKGEETSLRSWMEVSEAGLDTATRELERNPFERLMRFLRSIGMKDPMDGPPSQHV